MLLECAWVASRTPPPPPRVGRVDVAWDPWPSKEPTMQCSSIRYNIMSLLGAYLITLLSPRDGNVDEGGRKRFALSRRTENKRERVPWVTDTPMGSCTRRHRLFGGTGACVRACASSKLVSFLRCLTGLPRKRGSRTVVHPSPRRRHQGLVDAGVRRHRTQRNATYPVPFSYALDPSNQR